MALSDIDKTKIKDMFKLLQGENFKERVHGEIPNAIEGNDNQRNPYQRDYSRILYSSSFRRLQGKMQILGIDNTSFHRNRLTHSLEVSQLATAIMVSLYQMMGGNAIPCDNLYVLEAAALAHDIGHPAFGHSGERTLDKLAKEYNLRFEGNAHNFRILNEIEKKFPNFKGLNLTYRTLLAINKYNVKEDSEIEKFMFERDYDILKAFREKNQLENKRTIDVQIIEIADDLAYAVHDLEDGLSTRSFTIDEILYRLNLRVQDAILGEKEYNEFKNLVEKAKQYALGSSTYKTNQEYSQVFRQKITTDLVKLLLSDLSLEKVDEETAKERGILKDTEELSMGRYYPLCKTLSKEIFRCITREPFIELYERRGEKVINGLFDLYSNPETNRNGKLLPPDFRNNLTIKDDSGNEQINKIGYAQSAIDYIAGMMDDYAKLQYKNYFGQSFNEIPL